MKPLKGEAQFPARGEVSRDGPEAVMAANMGWL